jgi:hypothetical protein
MRLRNATHSIKYSKLANKQLQPDGVTRDLPVIRDFISDLIDSCRGMIVTLDPSDLDAINSLLDRAKEQPIDFSMLSIHDDDPTGMKEKDRVLRERRATKQAMQSEAMRILREREERIKAESNMLDESGNPINDKLLSQASIKDIKPELHPEMGNELDKIMANNMAVLEKKDEEKPKVPYTLTLGVDDFAKDRNAIMAKRDGTPVPHDPKHYQSETRAVPPGVPDVPGAAQQYRDASNWRPAPGMPTT